MLFGGGPVNAAVILLSHDFQSVEMKQNAIAFLAFIAGFAIALFGITFLDAIWIFSSAENGVSQWLIDHGLSEIRYSLWTFVSLHLPEWTFVFISGIVFGLCFQNWVLIPGLAFCAGVFSMPHIASLVYGFNTWNMVGIDVTISTTLWGLMLFPLFFIGATIGTRPISELAGLKINFSITRLLIVTGLVAVAVEAILRSRIIGIPGSLLGTTSYVAYNGMHWALRNRCEPDKATP